MHSTPVMHQGEIEHDARALAMAILVFVRVGAAHVREEQGVAGYEGTGVSRRQRCRNWYSLYRV